MRLYLDWNATTPPLDDVLEAMQAAARDAWANPASVHGDGRRARSYVEDARAAIGELTHSDPRDVIFTSGGTEANNLALRSVFTGAASGRVLVTSRLEHPSVTRVAEALAEEGKARVHWLAVTEGGQIDLADLERVLEGGEVALVTIQAANHETGALQPIDEVLRLAQRKDARVHVDAVQAFGKIPWTHPPTKGLSFNVAAHKLRGPKGIGALITAPDMKIEPVLRGGAQERGIRPGTLDPIAAAGFAVAARHAQTSPSVYATIAPLRDQLVAALRALSPDILVNGAPPRMPHVINLSFPAWNGPELVAALDLEQVSVSSGSACSAGTVDPSPVITAMLGEPRARSAIRISLGETTTAAETSRALTAFAQVLGRAPH